MAKEAGGEYSDFRQNDWPKGLYRRKDCFRFRRQYQGKDVSFSLGDITEREALGKAEEFNTKLRAGVDLSTEIKRAAVSSIVQTGFSFNAARVGLFKGGGFEYFFSDFGEKSSFLVLLEVGGF